MDLNIYTLCRSGNHAIIFWLINNICPIEDSIQGACYWNTTEKLYFYNNCNHIPYYFVTDYKYMIKSYEDMNFEDSNIGVNNIVIVRDFTNFIASRYKKYGNNLGLNDSYLLKYEQIRDLWINLCNKVINNKAIGIIYDKWVISKDYRDSISNRLGIENSVDNTSFVSDIGEGSSFCGVQLEKSCDAYFNRFTKDLFANNYDLYEKILDDYENNKEIKNIREILFN